MFYPITPCSDRSRNAWRERALLGAFTLIEVMVSITILTLILAIVLGMTSAVSKAWKKSTANLEVFRAARVALDEVSEKLSQATLNTYLDYDPPQTGTSTPPPPTRYIRQSELHFCSGKTLVNGQISQSVFFQAPIGYAVDQSHYGGLNHLLNACGFYIMFGDNSSERPSFLSSNIVPIRNRFRLIEFNQGSELLSVYNSATGMDWIIKPNNPPRGHVVAENIVAMVLIPKAAPGSILSKGKSLVSDYEYNSRLSVDDDPQPSTAHQLPPLMEVILVAITEESAARLQRQFGVQQPDLGFSYKTVFQKADQIDVDLKIVETALLDKKIDFRIFRSDVPLRNSKWSE